MFELFSNPGYLVAGGALLSAPIIIHLINRMRFRRVQWAAMEFLLKSQKRNRRRLIIEQLLLLMLRCLLVFLAALMVLRFVFPGIAGFNRQDGLHMIVLDDTLSMNDRWQENAEEHNSFKVAKDDVILKRIYNNVAQSTTNERLVIIPLSHLLKDPDYQPKIYQRLGETATQTELANDLAQMKPTQLRVELARGIEKASDIIKEHPEKRHVLHIVSDFRRRDWTGPESNQLTKVLRGLVEKKVKINPIDTAHPFRTGQQGGALLSHDNVGIVDFRPNTRVVGKGMPVVFTITVANYSSVQKSLNVSVRDDLTGQEMAQIDFNPPMPLKVPAGGTATTSFEIKLFPDIKGKDEFHAQKLSARLETAQRTPLEDDGLPEDNVRFASVEIRNKVPVLIVDGQGSRGLQEGWDSYFVSKAITSVTGANYELVYGHEVAGGNPAKALEQPDLHKYPTIFILNVRELTDPQRDNLENYVREGGGVCFFLGPQVNGKHYREKLYRGGEGVFPAPIKDNYYPTFGLPPLKPTFTGDPQLLLRRDQFGPTVELPIFGSIITSEVQEIIFLSDLFVNRYFQVSRADWVKKPGKVHELATLPNKGTAAAYRSAVLVLAQKLPTNDPKYKEYWPALERHAAALRRVVEPGSDAKAYHLAGKLKKMLDDQGNTEDAKEYPNLTNFWNLSDNKIRPLKQEAQALFESTQYGDPFVVAGQFGKGRVVAVMSTAGKETISREQWNNWGGAFGAGRVYMLFVWMTQNYLSSQTSESNRTVGSPVVLNIDLNRYKKQGITQLKMVRTFYKAVADQPIEQKTEAPEFGSVKNNIATFRFTNTYEPGFYLTQLFANDVVGLPPLNTWGHVFNVDTENEGKLQRVTQQELDQQSENNQSIIGNIVSPDEPQTELVNRQQDLSELAVFFLIFLIILVCEQALAVHLSFHMKANEGMSPGQVSPARARAA